jgi:outer membrane protein OmpA-like peptidoglycan-associated protein
MKKIALIMALCPLSVWALNVEMHNQSQGTTFMRTEEVRNWQDFGKGGILLQANYSYIEDPLVATNPERTERTGTLVEGINALHLGASRQIGTRTTLGASSFMGQLRTSDREWQYAMGDTTLKLKHRVGSMASVHGFALTGEITLPTGNETHFLSDGGTSFGLGAVYERVWGPLKFAANGIFKHSSRARYQDLDYRNRLIGLLGVSFDIMDRLALVSELRSEAMIPYDSNNNPGELFAGALWRQSTQLSYHAGLGIGELGGVGSGEFRILAGIKYIPRLRKEGPTLSPQLTRRMLEVQDRIQFEHDSANLTEGSKVALAKLVQEISSEQAMMQRLVIEGHTNRVGDESYNEKLSEARAKTVKEFFVSNGLPDKILDVEAYGESKPLPIDDWSIAKEQNRRVQFRVE